MACIEHYIKDAENIIEEIKLRHKFAQDNIWIEYKAARHIQRWFRGYITRKHLKYLNDCALRIQKMWRGHRGRKIYSKLLSDTVHKMYWDHYNLMATTIQKVWRGHFVRSHVFSYYKLKAYINEILEKNKMFLENAKKYQQYTERAQRLRQEQECKDWLAYLSFRVHHLIRTHQIEGIYSEHGTFQYSAVEQYLKNIKFKDYMGKKRAKHGKKMLKEPMQNHIFKGRLRECEDIWNHRNDPGKYSLATGEYEEDFKTYTQQERIKEKLALIQDNPMHFGPVIHPNELQLDMKSYKCPPLHQTIKKLPKI